jgi:hypothetical protein
MLLKKVITPHHTPHPVTVNMVTATEIVSLVLMGPKVLKGLQVPMGQQVPMVTLAPRALKVPRVKLVRKEELVNRVLLVVQVMLDTLALPVQQVPPDLKAL